MTFQIPQAQFDALGGARRFLINANDLTYLISDKFMQNYRDLWGVSDQLTGSIHSVADVQAKLDIMGSTPKEEVPASILALINPPSELTEIPVSIQALVAASALVQFIATIYPNVLPERYHTAAFNYTINPDLTLTIVDLKTTWSANV